MNLNRNSSVFSTSSFSTYSNDGESSSISSSGSGSSGRRLSYFNWDGFKPDPNFWNIDDDDDDIPSSSSSSSSSTTKPTAATTSNAPVRASPAQVKVQQKDTKKAPSKTTTPTPKKATPTPQAKSAIKRASATPSDAAGMSSIEAARMSASPLASKKPRTSVPSPLTKVKPTAAAASPKTRTPGKTVSFASALTETYDAKDGKTGSPAKRGVDLRTKVGSSPSPAKPALKRTVTPSKSPQTLSRAGGSKESTPVKSVMNADVIRMIQEQNARIERLEKELEKEKAARVALEKRLKFY